MAEMEKTAMLADGSNPEGVDPQPPLEWTRESIMNSKVTVYGVVGSPPCSKLLFYLNFYGVKHELVGGPKPGSDYKKFPVVDIGDRQVNDSAVILKHLVPALVGDGGFDAAWETKITYGLQVSIENEIMGSYEDFAAWAGEPHGFGIPSFVIYCGGSMIMSTIRKGILANPLNTVVDPATILAEFAAAKGDKPFFGGDEPAAVDISTYGTLASFVQSEVAIALSLVGGAGLWPWFVKMDEKAPLKAIYPLTNLDLKKIENDTK